jgi:hypothetical protein
MKPDLRNNKDFLAGILFVVVGALVIASGYPMGAVARIGPGYFPTILGAIVILFGLCVLARGIASGAKVKGEWGWRLLAWVALSILARHGGHQGRRC